MGLLKYPLLMTDVQKQIFRYLLKESYTFGFAGYPLRDFASKLNLTLDDLFDESGDGVPMGILVEYSEYGKGLIYVKREGDEVYAGVNFDCKEMLEHWCE